MFLFISTLLARRRHHKPQFIAVHCKHAIIYGLLNWTNSIAKEQFRHIMTLPIFFVSNAHYGSFCAHVHSGMIDQLCYAVSFNFTVELILGWRKSANVFTGCLVTHVTFMSPQPPLHRLWHWGGPRHLESLGWSIWAVRRGNPAQGMVRSSPAWRYSLHLQHSDAAVWFWLLHQQTRLFNTVLQ